MQWSAARILMLQTAVIVSFSNFMLYYAVIIIINKVLIKVTLNKVIAGALYS